MGIASEFWNALVNGSPRARGLTVLTVNLPAMGSLQRVLPVSPRSPSEFPLRVLTTALGVEILTAAGEQILVPPPS